MNVRFTVKQVLAAQQLANRQAAGEHLDRADFVNYYKLFRAGRNLIARLDAANTLVTTLTQTARTLADNSYNAGRADVEQYIPSEYRLTPDLDPAPVGGFGSYGLLDENGQGFDINALIDIRCDY